MSEYRNVSAGLRAGRVRGLLLQTAMDSNFILYIVCGAILAIGSEAQNNLCTRGQFWNGDIGQCVPCSTCKDYPKTPSCETCVAPEDHSDGWKLAAITSFSALAVLLVLGVLLLGVLVHRYRSRRRTLREPIEETTGPLYQA